MCVVVTSIHGKMLLAVTARTRSVRQKIQSGPNQNVDQTYTEQYT
jgi:hypothetical protein